MKIDPVKYQSSFFERSFFKRIKRHFEHMIRKQPEMCYQSFLLHIHYSIKVHTPEHYCPYHRNVMVGSNPFPNIRTRTVSTIPEPHYPYHLPFKKNPYGKIRTCVLYRTDPDFRYGTGIYAAWSIVWTPYTRI